MKKQSLLFCLLLCLAFVGCGDKKSSTKQQADLLMDSVLMQNRHVGLAVAVVKDNKVVYTKEFGVKNIASKEKIQADDIFRIASISKTFTATAIMQLIEQGKFNLDDDISDALGFILRNPTHPNEKITYRMLLSHTSSLSDKSGYFNFDIVNPKKNSDLTSIFSSPSPGSEYKYCNLGYNLLGALIEIHSGLRFDNYISQHILEPLGINNSGFNVNSLNKNKFVTLYSLSPETAEWVEEKNAYKSIDLDFNNYQLGRDAFVFSPTGGMKMSIEDLTKWMLCRMNYGTLNGVEIISENSAEIMNIALTPVAHRVSYGLGMFVSNSLVSETLMFGHSGSAYGLQSSMFFNPFSNFGVAILCNGCSNEQMYGNTKLIWDITNAMHEVFNQ